MERILFILLLNVMTTTSSRDGDYSGGMLNYGMDSSEEDVEISPEAEATYDVDDKDDVENGGRKGHVEHIHNMMNQYKKTQLKSNNNDDINYDFLDNREEVTERKSMPKMKRRQSDRRNKYYSNDSEDKYIKSIPEINIDDDRIAFKEDSREEYQIEGFETEPYNLNRRKTTNRKARRKPRDRPINKKRSDGDEFKPDEENDKELKQALRDVTPFKDPPLKGFREYDFYDMKRINNLKEKLPDIIPTKEDVSESSRNKSTSELPYRRALVPEKSETTKTSSTYLLKINTSGTIPNTTTINKKSMNTSELSLAERSRLSILRKVKKKENLNKTLTTKPPVLMQVTDRMQTVVLVEGHNENDERFRVKEVMDNSPHRIARAKQLMRHKLVADAKNIQELTDNWDEMICDYIDVSLLDSRNSVSRNPLISSDSKIFLYAFTILMWL